MVGVEACLGFVEFFAQEKDTKMVVGVVPVLERLLGYEDEKVLKSVGECVRRICEWAKEAAVVTDALVEGVMGHLALGGDYVLALQAIVKQDGVRVLKLGLGAAVLRVLTTSVTDADLGKLLGVMSQVFPELKLENASEIKPSDMPLYVAYTEMFVTLLAERCVESVDMLIKLRVVSFMARCVRFVKSQEGEMWKSMSGMLASIFSQTAFESSTPCKNAVGCVQGCVYILDRCDQGDYEDLVALFTREG
jgi:hypothetical protein